MGHWVTLPDTDQHVFISDGGKVLATRGAISSAGGGKERGKALAARSKAAIGKATAGKRKPSLKEQAAAHRAKQRGGLTKTHVEMTASVLRQQHALKTGNDEQFMKFRGRWNEMEEQTKEYRSVGRGNVQRTNPSAAIAHEVAGSVENRVKERVAARTTRAIEHAKAAGPSLREQADKARAAKGTARDRAQAVVARLKKTAFFARNEAMRLMSKPSKLRGWEKEKLAKLDAKTGRNFARSDAIRTKFLIGQ